MPPSNNNYAQINHLQYGFDVIAGITLKNYNIGDHFEFKYYGVTLGEITLTNDNKNEMFFPIQNRFPFIYLPLYSDISLNYNFSLNCTTRIIDQPFTIYFINLSSEFRIEIANYLNIMNLDDNIMIDGFKFPYLYFRR